MTTTKPRTATGYVEHYEVELDGDILLRGSAKIGYRIIRPAGYSFAYGGRNPAEYERDIEWWAEDINDLVLVPPQAGDNIPVALGEASYGWLIEHVTHRLNDYKVSRACAKHYDSQVL